MFPGEGHGNPLQYSCLENPVDGGAWQATVHRVTESDTTEHTHSTVCVWCMMWGAGAKLKQKQGSLACG